MLPTINADHLPVDPLAGATPWVGGKRNLAREIISRIEAIPHTCYAEPFVGAGGVFLRRRNRPPAEVINDRSRDVATFFRVLQRHPDALLAELALTVTSRVEFERLAGILRGLQGRFLMSLNDLPEVRETFSGFEIETVETTCRMNGAKRVREVIISGGGKG